MAICPEDEWQGRKLLASRDYSDEDEVEVAFSFTSGHRRSHDLLAMTPIYWQPDVACKFCSLSTGNDETNTRIPKERRDSGKTCLHSNAGSEERSVFERTDPIEMSPVSSVRTIGVTKHCCSSQLQQQKPQHSWHHYRALSKSAPDVTLVDVYPSFLCYSSFVELDSSTYWQCRDCIGRAHCNSNQNVCLPSEQHHTVSAGGRRCSTVASVPLCSSPTHLRKTTPQCTTNKNNPGYRVS